MRTVLKNVILNTLPLPVRKAIVFCRELWWRLSMRSWERDTYPHLLYERTSSKTRRKNVLVYSVCGLAHGGTEKNLQVIANGLTDACNVFFMYGNKNIALGREETMHPSITLIPFTYDMNETAVPHRLTGMSPHLKEVLAEKNIDVLVTASPGYAHYPWNVITDLPILLLNIFGAPVLQKNVKAVIYNSYTTRDHAAQWIGTRGTDQVLYAPLAKLPPNGTRDAGMVLRDRLGIMQDDFVFGRIGRNDDNIFDPIGIQAWERIASKHSDAHYLIMSPPPSLIKIVEERGIPRVHFLPPSGNEEDVWAFHGALDCFAHFRKDGETSGVAIAESLTIGNPVITHRSSIWNAHLEYLTEDCSRIADIDDVQSYAAYMEEYLGLKRTDVIRWDSMQMAAKNLGNRHFSPELYVKNIRDIVQQL